jgi:hypothetical protein
MSGLIAEDSPTGGADLFYPAFGPIGYRKLNESQGARSDHYQVSFRGTWDEVKTRGRSLNPVHRIGEFHKKIVATTAKREHVARLLRKCQNIVAQLVGCDDRLELAALGAELCDNLQELWRHRVAREDDWIEVLNLMQIVLRGEIIEQMTSSKKRALAEIFNGSLTIRTIGSIEAQRAFRILRGAGFDVWRGVGQVGE